VPIFVSVDDLLSALQHFDRPGESDAIRNAFHRGVEAKFGAPPTPVPTPRSRVRTLTWAAEPHRPAPIPLPSQPPPRRLVASTRSFIVLATILAAAAAWGMFRAVRPQPIAHADVMASTTAPVSLPQSVPPPAAGKAPPPALPAPELDSRAGPAPIASPPRPAPAHDPPPVRDARSARPIADSRPGVRTVGPPVVPLPNHADPLRDAETQASALIAAGRVDEAEIVFDSILFKNPSYRLDPVISDSEATAVFRRSKRLIVPAIAREHYNWAIEALQAGDAYRAVLEAGLAATLIADSDLDTSASELRRSISELGTRARAAREIEERKIYSSANTEVVPPRPLGRQLPASPPAGIGNELTGRLEILVDRSGRVESVKLYTPRNSYHDRMIVSAAKAWHYAPATKNGRAVRFNIVMSINLPQS